MLGSSAVLWRVNSVVGGARVLPYLCGADVLLRLPLTAVSCAGVVGPRCCTYCGTLPDGSLRIRILEGALRLSSDGAGLADRVCPRPPPGVGGSGACRRFESAALPRLPVP